MCTGEHHYTLRGVIRHGFVSPTRQRGSCAICDSGSTTYQTAFEPVRLIPPAQGEVGEALGTGNTHESALKGAVQTPPMTKLRRNRAGTAPSGNAVKDFLIGVFFIRVFRVIRGELEAGTITCCVLWISLAG